ncbi:MAG: hypothetical protein U0903_01465 [Planctomycetales bacterium]
MTVIRNCGNSGKIISLAMSFNRLANPSSLTFAGSFRGDVSDIHRQPPGAACGVAGFPNRAFFIAVNFRSSRGSQIKHCDLGR